jgi:hypothetical protein
MADAVEMKYFPRLALLVLSVGAAACGHSSGPAEPAEQPAPPADAEHGGHFDRLADAAKAGEGVAADASRMAPDAPADDANAGADVGPGGDRAVRSTIDAGRALDGSAREAGHLRLCMPGATCGANAHCEHPCMGQLVYRCTCTEGHLVCTGCIAVDGGAADSGTSGFCPGNVSVQGRRCDHGGEVCHYATDGGQRLCACGNVGPQPLWICQ